MSEPSRTPSNSSENSIWALHNLRDRIIAAFNRHIELEEATRNMWCGDAKEMYYTVVLLDGLLSRAENAEMARPWLFTASSHFGRVQSELRAVHETELEEELTQAFRACHDALSARIPNIPPASTAAPRIIQNSPESYELPCSLCSRMAVSVRLADTEEKILQGVICAGISRKVGLNVKEKERIFGWLAKEDLASLHQYMDRECDIEGGLDAYCPMCDRIYCRAHYNVSEVWDEGFYDCSKGICPQGHARTIDD